MNSKRNTIIAALFVIVLSVFILFGGCSSSGVYSYKNNGDGTCTITDYRGPENVHINIPAVIDGLTVTAIGNNAFLWVYNYPSLSIPETVITIEYSALNGNSCLKAIEVSERNQYYSSLDGVLFNKDKTVLILAPAGMSREKYVIPNGVTTIEMSAFSYCFDLQKIALPDSLTIIESHAFAGCRDLADITIPDNVVTIGSGAFEDCWSLKEIIIPANVTDIGFDAFTGCHQLETIEVSEQNQWYSSLDGILFNKDKTILIKAPEGITKENYSIPATVKTIDMSAFSNCRWLSGCLVIPASVTFIGSNAFAECSNLREISLPDSLEEIGFASFYKCESLESITIPSSLTTIDDLAFCGNTSLKKVTISDGVKAINHSAFSECRRLSEVEFLGDAPDFVDKSAFEYCADDFKIIYNPEKTGWKTPTWNGYPCYPG